MALLFNRARMTTATTGTGTITLGSAVSKFQSFADAGVTDGAVVRYTIEDGTAWEIGEGTYTATGTTLSRTVLESSNADAAISLSGSAEVFIDAAAEDLAGGGGLVPISKTTSTTASATDISLTGGYTSYEIRVLKFNPSSDGAGIEMRVSNDGGSTFLAGTNYNYTRAETFNQTWQIASASGQDAFLLLQNVGSAAGEAGYATIRLYVGDGTYPAHVSSKAGGHEKDAGKFDVCWTEGQVTGDATAVDAVRLLDSFGGTHDAEYHLYGIADGDA